MSKTNNSTRSIARRFLVAGSGIAVAVSLALAGPAAAETNTAKPTVVFVHGAWTDASSFTGVEQILTEDGYPTLDFANPLRSLRGDAAYLATFLATRTEGPVILVGHSYGGAVVSAAALSDPDVKSLVYVDAFVPAEGESLLDLLSSAGPVDPTLLFDTVPYPNAPDGDVDLYLKKDAFDAGFANGLTPAQAASFYSQQRPITLGAVNEKAPAGEAWKTLPSSYVAGTQDGSIPITLQLEMAERAGSAVTQVEAGHLSMVKESTTVAHVIEKAAADTK